MDCRRIGERSDAVLRTAIPAMTNLGDPVKLHSLVTVVAAVATLAAGNPARADRCDDLAAQIARQIDGVKVGKTVAGNVYLTHPAVKQASLGCAARNKQNEIFATSLKRKPSKEFFDFVASATALVFTIP